MSSDDITHFQFDFGGINLEVSGERAFVERMYRRVMHDVALVRSGKHRDKPAEEVVKPAVSKVEAETVVWVHSCSPMMQKIYMTTSSHFDKTILSQCLAAGGLKGVYLDRELLPDLIPGLHESHTLWAKLTDAGREKIAGAKPLV